MNGSGIPDVNFDIGESYAGTLSIDDNVNNTNQLWFWFIPSENPAASDEITIWLNGGPGCSSLDGLLQENGPFLWQSGTYEPQPNPFSYTNLTNMVWVDQPIGTGFSPAAPGAPANITNEVDVGRDFAGFWKNFMTTFNMTGRSVYITGESYAGQYIPYIASYMLDQNDTEYYNVKGIQINDPSIGLDEVLIYGNQRRYEPCIIITDMHSAGCHSLEQLRQRIRLEREFHDRHQSTSRRLWLFRLHVRSIDFSSCRKVHSTKPNAQHE